MTIKMNKVDILVRELLLTYPMLYQSRIDALLAIFDNSGYSWNDEGCLVRNYKLSRDPSTMDYSDLDEAAVDIEKDLADDCEYIRPLTLRRKFEMEQERMVREHRAANIDLVASEKPSGARFTYEKLNHLYFTGLMEAPFGKIDKDFLEAAEELMEVLQYSFNLIFGLQYDKPLAGDKAPEPSMFSRMPQSFQSLHNKITAFEDKIEEQSGKKARMAAFWAREGSRIMAEIIEEDNQKVD